MLTKDDGEEFTDFEELPDPQKFRYLFIEMKNIGHEIRKNRISTYVSGAILLLGILSYWLKS